ncbi:relaxase/mobilization nuclease domain-containing protein [Pseudomonas sp. 50_B]|uniref:relaxase/mobilization nuclease domain-containing protein n=1 Tax=Pseudomonas sp. 50_B TaxID=2813574 RepID=UPI001A9D033A|nr:relaxase/mobilization nuclease domain-containing protein [Pseudomonas sp. 50_B]
MIRKVISKLPDSASVGRTMNYALNKAELVSGSETKFDGTSIKNYNKLGVKKFNQINNKFEAATGRKQEVVAVHEVISFSPKDNLTNEQALEIAMSVWKVALNLDNRKYRVAVHDKDDNGKTHVHLIWNSRDNKGKPFKKNGDYELFEKLCHQAELKHGLEEVKNRKYLNPKMPTNPQGPNEYRLENRGIKSEKTKFKEAVNASTDKAMTASEFLEFLDADGFTLITNGNNAYSLEKEGQIFKASEIGASYKLLKARFGDDPTFSDTLARLGVKTAPIRKMGSIGGDFHDQQSAIIERRAKKSNRVVDTRFDTPDGHDFFFKNSTKKAFEYDPVAGRADFNTNSPMAIKAGLQKLTETGKPQTLHLNGTETFKRQAWLQFHMMNLDKKGYSLSGFKPSSLDKAELEKMKNENPAFKKPIQENNIKALPTEKVAEKPKDAESKDAASTIANGAVKIAASVLDGAIDKITDMSDGNAKDVLAAMHMLEEQIERSNREKQKTRKATFKNKLTPQ